MELQLWLAKIDIPGLVPGLWNHPPDRDTWCSGIPNGLQSAQLLADPNVGIIFCLKHQAQFSKSMLIPQRPENYTKSLIKTVGWVDETSGYIPHELQFATMKVRFYRHCKFFYNPIFTTLPAFLSSLQALNFIFGDFI